MGTERADLFKFPGEGVDEAFLFGFEGVDEVLLLLAVSTPDRAGRGG